MIDENTLYLERNNRSTTVCKLDGVYVENQTIIKIIDEALWPLLSTYEGRVVSTRKIFDIHRGTPIYISKGLILQPVYNIDAWNALYINADKVLSFEQIENETVVEFVNHTKIQISVSFARFKKFMSNCDIIKMYQIKKERGF